MDIFVFLRKSVNAMKMFYFGIVSRWVSPQKATIDTRNEEMMKKQNLHSHDSLAATVEVARVTTNIKHRAEMNVEQTGH